MSGYDAPPPPQPLLRDGQRQVVATAITFSALTLIMGLIVAAVWVLGLIVSIFSGVLWPLAVAGILALILRPVVEFIERRLRISRLSSVLLVAGLMLLVLAGILLLIVPPAIAQIVDLIAYLPTVWNDAIQYLTLHYPQWIDLAQHQLENPTIKSMVEQLATEAQTLAKQALASLLTVGGRAMSLISFFTHLAVVPIFLFFFLLSRGKPAANLASQLPFLQPSVRNDVVFLVREFLSIVVSFFRGQLLIGVVMGVLYGIGFSIVGLRFGAIIGMFLGFLNIVPYLGSIIGLVITVPLALFQPDGGWQLVLFVLCVQVLVQNVEGWFLTPKIMSESTGLHPVMVITAIFFWGIALDGVLGMILAIPLTAFFVTAWRLARRKYFGVGGLEGLGDRV